MDPSPRQKVNKETTAIDKTDQVNLISCYRPFYYQSSGVHILLKGT